MYFVVIKDLASFILCWSILYISYLEFSESLQNLPSPFYSLSTSNVRRCGKLCERQGKCAAVTFDAKMRMCYLFDREVPITTSNTERFQSTNYPHNVGYHDDIRTCEKESELIVPSLRYKDGDCLVFTGLKPDELCCEVCDHMGMYNCSSLRWWCNRNYVRRSDDRCVKAITVILQSEPFGTRIYIDDQEILLERGLHILEFSGSNGTYEGKTKFQIHSGADVSNETIEYLQKIEDGKLLVFLSSDEINKFMTTSLRNYLENNYDSTYISDLQYRDVWYLAAFQGGKKLYEDVSKRDLSSEWPKPLRLEFQVYSENEVTVFQVIGG